MVGVSKFLEFMLLATSARAFFIWPPLPCDPGEPCYVSGSTDVGGKTLAAAGGQFHSPSPPGGQPETNGFISLSVVQRNADPNESLEAGAARAARDARRIAYRFATLDNPRVAAKRSRLATRTNTYSVVEPERTERKDSAGIYHDPSDYAYFAKVQFGSSKKPLYMLLDTGSSTAWIMGSTCKSDACLYHDLFGVSDSKTLKLQSKEFRLAYGTGAVAGTLARDSVSLAGISIDMSFGLANETSSDFTHFAFDGILGLDMAVGSTDGFVTELVKQKVLQSNIFAVTLGRASDPSNEGQITFGAVDSSKYKGDITYTDLAKENKGAWVIPIDGFGFGGKKVTLKDRTTYIDTGTSFAFGPQSDVTALHKLIPGSTTVDEVTWYVPCSDSPIEITFSGVTYKISAKDWQAGSGTSCRSNIYGREVVTNGWLLGDVFLKNVYSVFDVDKKRIGFATKAESVAATTPSVTQTSQTAAGTVSSDGTPTLADATGQSATPSGKDSAGYQLKSNAYALVLGITVIAAAMMA
ncbi:aspartic peptidase domain-containing protein [Pseudoneurospora amorphoporcata]|uniref:Aspartic peptidase domain-containing protein n=1 Tax=Pseudoneurospora amorphoporcata TaxID=241081 RepID=A0AAN6NW44_9PEZI|nr:aspartic peptidase domain-containing protein [Pseudoneurospora amorphoporcata]